jgi:hypothetical protein
MRFKSGKHEGMITEQVALTEPHFAQWTIEQYPESPHGQEFIRHWRDFDDKPFTEDCHGECGRKATRASAYRGGPSLFFWCNKCSPSSTGAHSGKLTTIHTVSELLQHVDWSAGGNRALKTRLVRQLAEAKGLPKRVGEAQALEFFSPSPTRHARAMELLRMVRQPQRRRKRRRLGMLGR